MHIGILMKTLKSSAALVCAMMALSVAATLCPEANAQTVPTTASTMRSYDIEVPATKEWVDTNIDVHGGAKLRFTAKGQITYPADQSYSGRMHTAGTAGPDGLPRNFADLLHQYAVGDAGHGALIGRIGSADYAQAFLVGASKEYDVPVAGRLSVGINQSASEAATATGSFHVRVEILDEGLKDATNRRVRARNYCLPPGTPPARF